MNQDAEKINISANIENEIKQLKVSLDFQTFTIAREASKTRATIWIVFFISVIFSATVILSPDLVIPLLGISGLCILTALIGKQLGIIFSRKSKP